MESWTCRNCQHKNYGIMRRCFCCGAKRDASAPKDTAQVVDELRNIIEGARQEAILPEEKPGVSG